MRAAFDAYQVRDGITKGSKGFTYTITPVFGIPRPLFYNHEMINRREAMNPDTGIFTVPRDGAYLFFVSFCTAADMGTNPTTVALVNNQTTSELFSVPDVADPTEMFRFAVPPMPVELQDAQQGVMVNDVKRHAFTVMKRLGKGQKVSLELRKGMLVELADANAKSVACTRFSGFRIN